MSDLVSLVPNANDGGEDGRIRRIDGRSEAHVSNQESF